MKPVDFHSRAEAEYLKAVRRYEKQRPGLGLEFQHEIEDAVQRMRRSPRQYALYADRDIRQCIIRRFPYSILYAELEDHIWIAAVAHHKRRPGYWAKRKPE